MVGVSILKVGDILVIHSGEVEITALERTENGTVLINGGLDENNFDLAAHETGVFYKGGYSNAKTGIRSERLQSGYPQISCITTHPIWTVEKSCIIPVIS